MSLITLPELNLNYELENSKLTEEYIVNNFKTVRNGLLKEIIENFGSYMGPVKFDTKYKSIFDVTPEQKETLNPNVELPSENKENIIDGLLRFSKALNFGSDSGNYSAWVSCVKLMGAWYENNVHTYSHDGNYMHCPLINKNIRPDCSGYVGACLQLYGLLSDYSWMPSSGYYVNDEKLAEELKKGGFVKMDFSWDVVKPFDIMSRAPSTGPNGHVEIFAGKQNGTMKSYGWGARHDKASGKCMPWYTNKDNYTVIWRCVGGGSLSGGLFGKLDLSGVDDKHITLNERTAIAMKFFMDKGLSKAGAAGLVGNLMRESRLDPTAQNPGRDKAFGIAQWLGARKSQLFSRYGSRPSLANQLEFVWYELNTSHKTALKYLKAATSAAEGAKYAMGYYEFSAGPEGAIRAMNKSGQNGELSMKQGIAFAIKIMNSIK